MIKINLIERKKATKLPVVLGVDLNEVNFKPIVAVYLLSFIPENFIYTSFENEVKHSEDKVRLMNNRYRKMRKGGKQDKLLREKLLAYDKQVQKLKDRGRQVDKIIKEKTNPKEILSNLSRVTPGDLWINFLQISSAGNIKLDGESTSYRSVGNFINNLNELRFFNGSLIIKASTEIEKKIQKSSYRLQKFDVEGKVTSYGANN